MADIKISALPNAAALTGTESIPAVQAGGNVKIPVSAIRAPLVASTYIGGLQLIWVNATTVAVSSGEAYVPGAGGIVSLAAQTSVNISGMPWVGPDRQGHVYLTATGTLRVTNTAPAAPYMGPARTQTGDTSTRYLGSILLMPDSKIAKFTHDMGSGMISYFENLALAPFAVVNGTAPTTATDVPVSAIVPPGVIRVILVGSNTATDQTLYIGNADTVVPLDSSGQLTFMYARNATTMELPLSAAQTFNYKYTTAPAVGGMAYLRIGGYSLPR